MALGDQPGVHDGLDIVGRGGLALGAGKAGDGQLPRGVAVGKVGQQAHGLPDVGDPQAGQGNVGVGLLADVRKGPAVHSLAEVILLEFGSLAHKKGVGNDHLGITGHQGHGSGQVGGDGSLVGQQVMAQQQLHIVAQGLSLIHI